MATRMCFYEYGVISFSPNHLVERNKNKTLDMMSTTN